MTFIDPQHDTVLRNYAIKHGKPAVIDSDAEHVCEEVSQYGWVDYEPLVHTSDPDKVHQGEGCFWIIPEHAEIKSRTYRMYQGPYSKLKREAGFNVTSAYCHCGKYQNVTLRVSCSVGYVLQKFKEQT